MVRLLLRLIRTVLLAKAMLTMGAGRMMLKVENEKTTFPNIKCHRQ